MKIHDNPNDFRFAVVTKAHDVVDMVRQNRDHPMTRSQIVHHGRGSTKVLLAAIDYAVNAGAISLNVNGEPWPCTYTYVGELDDDRPTRPVTPATSMETIALDHLDLAILSIGENDRTTYHALISIAASLIEMTARQ